MPGAFAHMVAAELARDVAQKKGLHLIAKSTLMHTEWMQAGSVGPDYPYLHHLRSHDSSDRWSDLMHYANTGDVVRSGISFLSKWDGDRTSKEFFQSVAWLSGYLSHVVLDASIHPAVRATVGEYEENADEHRICEMYMDSYIYEETYKTELVNAGWADYLRHTTDESSGGMDSTIKTIWAHMLSNTYPTEYEKNSPNFDGWHSGYIWAIDMIDNDLTSLFRHAASEKGIVCTKCKDIPKESMTKYIEQVKTPTINRFGVTSMHYSKIFKLGVDNIVHYWVAMNAAIEGGGDISMPTLPNWNLDKGTTDSGGVGNATLWV